LLFCFGCLGFVVKEQIIEMCCDHAIFVEFHHLFSMSKALAVEEEEDEEEEEEEEEEIVAFGDSKKTSISQKEVCITFMCFCV